MMRGCALYLLDQIILICIRIDFWTKLCWRQGQINTGELILDLVDGWTMQGHFVQVPFSSVPGEQRTMRLVPGDSKEPEKGPLWKFWITLIFVSYDVPRSPCLATIYDLSLPGLLAYSKWVSIHQWKRDCQGNIFNCHKRTKRFKGQLRQYLLDPSYQRSLQVEIWSECLSVMALSFPISNRVGPHISYITGKRMTSVMTMTMTKTHTKTNANTKTRYIVQKKEVQGYQSWHADPKHPDHPDHLTTLTRFSGNSYESWESWEFLGI